MLFRSTIGLQRHGDAIMITLVALLTLLGVRFFEKAFKSLRRGVHALEPHEEEDS